MNFFYIKNRAILPIFRKDNITKNNEILQSKSLYKKYIIVKNNANEPDTLSEIIIQNNLDYIPKISVIIPVFNNELYLQQCLETVINQTLKEIEIICIDDGSTDNSLDILIKYAYKDKRITVLKQDNLHSGVARNAGLSIAKGEYLSFLDSDDWFELNMLEEMYKKIISNNGDIIICQCKSIDLESGKFDEKRLNYSLIHKLIPKKETFSVIDIPNNIFQFCQGWTWDKLFKADFIRDNNLRFQNIMNTNDVHFTFTALCLAKIITTINKRFIIKRHKHKNSLSSNRDKNPTCFLLSFDAIKSKLEEKGLFELVKESFWEWALSLSIIQLKTLNQESKVILYKILHKKLNLWDYVEKSPKASNRYRAINYIKQQEDFPTINIAYSTNHNFFKLCLISILSLLVNSEYENINIILLYNNIKQSDIRKLNELKEIRFFTLQTLYIEENEFNNYPLAEWLTKETWYRYILADKFPNIDKILYLDSDTIIRKSLLPLWGINLTIIKFGLKLGFFP